MKKIFRIIKRFAKNIIYLMQFDLRKTAGEMDAAIAIWGGYDFSTMQSIVEHGITVDRLQENARELDETAVDDSSDLIVSLTTYGTYIHTAHIAIESLLEQTVKPKKIILWISDEFSESDIPLILKAQEKRGLEIRFTRDIRSYKKLIPALNEFPEHPIVTFDDDLVYPHDALEMLYKAYKENPSMIYFRRGHRMKMNGETEFVPYKEFDWEIQDADISVMNFPTNGAGTLFPPHSLDDEVLNESAFQSLAPFADDVWFKAMSLKKGTLSRKVYSEHPPFMELDVLHKETCFRLSATNVIKNMNDTQIKAVWDRYNLWEKMRP